MAKNIMRPPLRFLFLTLLLTLHASRLLSADNGFWSGRTHVVYHLSEAVKAPFVLGSIRNHVKGAGGPEKIDIALVIHGDALDAFEAISASENHRKTVDELMKQGVRFYACANTMQTMSIKKEELLPGFIVAEKGGVVTIAELQSRGYLYLRP
jgi:intracellular sulfur oxidation DsrE/DsrF family protein